MIAIPTIKDTMGYMTNVVLGENTLDAFADMFAPAQDLCDVRRTRMINTALESAKLLFGVLHKDAEGKLQGGYTLYTTDEPGLFICKGPLESIPGTKGTEQGTAMYSVRAFVPEKPGEWRDESCREYCECKFCEVWGVCKHLLAVRIQIAKSQAILSTAQVPIYKPPIGSRTYAYSAP